MLYKLRLSALGLLASLALCGCDHGLSDAAVAADVALRGALEEAKTIQDPWAALIKLQDREAAILKANNPCYTPALGFETVCQPVPARQEVATERARLLGLAVDQRQPQAFAFLYSKLMESEDEYAALRRASVPKLLDYADKASGSQEDGLVLAAAGRIVAEGNYSIKDTEKAVAYYARAWGAGNAQAADGAALLFLSINDTRNAYLWSLRCTAGCQRTNDYRRSVTLESLQARLSPEAVKQAQQLAKSPSVVEIDTSGS